MSPERKRLIETRPDAYRRHLEQMRDWKRANRDRVDVYTMRQRARTHAAETGEAIEDVYARWNCELPPRQRR